MSIIIHAFWLSWKLYVYFQQSLWKYINVELLEQDIIWNLITSAFLLILMLPCWLLRQNRQAQLILPYICVISFGLSMCHDAYLSGIMSPVTGATLVISITLGLVLFERKLVYSAALICISTLGWMLFQTIKGKLVYAPLFVTLEIVDPTESTIFWTLTMLWFMFPFVCGGLILLEVLLTQWRKREKDVITLSQTDPLTGLYNRRSTSEYLQHLIKARSDTSNATHAVILLDLDLFKSINDIYGHSVGDEVLILVAQNLQENVREEDMVGRFGGEEFIIILSHISPEQTEEIAERCRVELMSLRLSDNKAKDLVITASFGISCFPSGDISVDAILKEADEALYRAKHLGRNQIAMNYNMLTLSSPHD